MRRTRPKEIQNMLTELDGALKENRIINSDKTFPLFHDGVTYYVFAVRDSMSDEESYRFHNLAARATLYPGKSVEEVNVELDIYHLQVEKRREKDGELQEKLSSGEITLGEFLSHYR